MRTFRILSVILLATLLLAGCHRTYQIEERAIQQAPLSVADELLSFNPTATDISVENIKTVYANDSICLLQLSAYYTVDSTLTREDIQYVYYIDLYESRFYRRNIFCEDFRSVPLLTDQEIREDARRVKKVRESVYDSFYGSGSRVHNSFDGK